MTTIIAVRNVGLYSDSICSYGINFSSPKLFTCKKWIMGGSGKAVTLELFAQWLSSNRKGSIKLKGLAALVMDKDRIYLYHGCTVPIEIQDDVYAVGTGAMAVMAAMAMGANPQQALDVAAKLDTMTGGKMQFLPYKR